MARKVTKKVDSSAIQGAGTYVVYREPSNAELADFRRTGASFNERLEGLKQLSPEFEAINEEASEYQAQFLSQYIIEWNWTEDEEGVMPLEQPEGNPTVIRELLPSEAQWLWSLFNVTTEKKLK